MITLDQFPEELKRLIAESAKQIQEEVMPLAGNDLAADIQARISEDGLDSNDNKISGAYSTKPAYFSKEQFVNKSGFKPTGTKGTKKTKVFDVKTKKGKGVAVKDDFTERRTMYLKQGYKEFRDIQGRETGFVNLTLSGSSVKAIRMYLVDGKVVIAIADEKESQKRKGNEKHYGKPIYPPSPKNIEHFGTSLIENSKAIIDKKFNNK